MTTLQPQVASKNKSRVSLQDACDHLESMTISGGAYNGTNFGSLVDNAAGYAVTAENGNLTIRGITPPLDPNESKSILIINANTNNQSRRIRFVHDNGKAAADHRIITPNVSAYDLNRYESVWLVWTPMFGKWLIQDIRR